MLRTQVALPGHQEEVHDDCGARGHEARGTTRGACGLIGGHGRLWPQTPPSDKSPARGSRETIPAVHPLNHQDHSGFCQISFEWNA